MESDTFPRFEPPGVGCASGGGKALIMTRDAKNKLTVGFLGILGGTLISLGLVGLRDTIESRLADPVVEERVECPPREVGHLKEGDVAVISTDFGTVSAVVLRISSCIETPGTVSITLALEGGVL